METTPLLLPAPVPRWCCLCNMALSGPPFQGRGFVVVAYTGRAYCVSCLDSQLPSRLQRFSLSVDLVELEGLAADLHAIVEAALHVPIGTLRDQVSDLALSLWSLGEKLLDESRQACAVCGCFQDEDGWWHQFIRGLEHKFPKRRRTWVADDLCSACIGYHTPENTLAGQCDCCQEYSSRLTVRGDSQWANCPDCFAKTLGRFASVRKGAR